MLFCVVVLRHSADQRLVTGQSWARGQSQAYTTPEAAFSDRSTVTQAYLSLANHKHKIYLYLLTGLTIDRPNQVWPTGITYIPMAKGFVYLVAVMDWYSRRVLSWKLSTTMDTGLSVEALEEAIERYGYSEIFNTDQGSQFASEEFTSVLKHNDINISMDGKGRWVDNVFVEPLWRSVKYEEVYLKVYDCVEIARESLGQYFEFYNTEWRHQSLGKQTSDSVYNQSVARIAV